MSSTKLAPVNPWSRVEKEPITTPCSQSPINPALADGERSAKMKEQ